jgi:hypothetical protein
LRLIVLIHISILDFVLSLDLPLDWFSKLQLPILPQKTKAPLEIFARRGKLKNTKTRLSQRGSANHTEETLKAKSRSHRTGRGESRERRKSTKLSQC